MRHVIAFFCAGLGLAAGQSDYTMNSASGNPELVHMENTGNNYKVLLGVYSNASDGGQGINVSYGGSASGWTGINNYLSMGDYTSAYGYSSSFNIGNQAYSEGIRHNTYAGDGGSHYGLRIGVQSYEYSYPTGAEIWAGGSTDSYVYGVNASAYTLTDNGNVYGVYGTAYGDYPAFVAAGYFDGKLYYGSLHAISDQKFKRNVRPLVGGLGKIMALKPHTYEMKVEEFKDKLKFDRGEKIGFIAQEVEQVLPQLVSDAVAPARLTIEERKNKVKKEPTKYKSLDYTGVIPVLVAAVQEQQAQIASLQAEVKALKAGK